MDSYIVALGSAVWLGILTSISPCPMATNIAAISFIGRRVENPRKVLASGLLYTLGRMLTYLVLGILIVASILSIPELAMFLQKNMNKFLGPILIVVGMFLLEMISFDLMRSDIGSRMQGRAERFGIWGAALLGLLFALSFCPVSAALFFGSLIPLAVEHNSAVVIPSVYGAGTALPVIVFAFVIAISARMVGVMFNKLKTFEKWARRVTGVVFILLGIHYTLAYIFGINMFN
ncbi:MAG: aromatic aminobenezylarsenical efflux permease ArsG family transporter [Candidatus Krumholzibacteriota bacterium]|nr:aromatic aminobenezylarsenical efflux permease ArsG family transporter [Candidatus Krumholzibacteriota bacterium]